jgi:hypothetical protein
MSQLCSDYVAGFPGGRCAHDAAHGAPDDELHGPGSVREWSGKGSGSASVGKYSARNILPPGGGAGAPGGGDFFRSGGAGGAAALDTLAQPDKNGSEGSASLSRSPSPTVPYQKRARAKYFTYALATRLAELRSPLEKSYRNTIYCAGCISQEDGILKTKYCGNRWCLVCNRIRTGRAVNVYLPILEKWADPHMVTLTVPNCSGDELSAVMGMMQTAFTSCKRSIKGTHKMEVRGVRKLECTFNKRRGDYHPHLHIIIDGAEVAELFRTLWIRRWKGLADAKAQDVRKVDSGGILEIFKYFTKLTAKTKDSKGRSVVPAESLDIIFRAMRGRRVWQPVGFKLLKVDEEAIEGETLEVVGARAFKREEDRVFWDWSQDVNDWLDRETGELLSEYVPAEKYAVFVSSISEETGEEKRALTGIDKAPLPGDDRGGGGGAGNGWKSDLTGRERGATGRLLLVGDP